MKPALKKVLLKKGAKFSALVSNKPGEKAVRKRYTGPCEVLMTAVQVKAFKDLLQTAPQVIIAEEAKPEHGVTAPGFSGEPEGESKPLAKK